VVRVFLGGLRVRWASTSLGFAGVFRLNATVPSYVTEMVITALSSPDFADALRARLVWDGDTSVLTAQRDADKQGLAELTRDRYVRRIIEEPEYLIARRELDARIAAAEEVLARQPQTRLLVDLPRGEEKLRTTWQERAASQASPNTHPGNLLGAGRLGGSEEGSRSFYGIRKEATTNVPTMGSKPQGRATTSLVPAGWLSPMLTDQRSTVRRERCSAPHDRQGVMRRSQIHLHTWGHSADGHEETP
jgi:hypothetical protein